MPNDAIRLIAAPGPSGFDWQSEVDVVVKPRGGLAAYLNPDGDVCLMVSLPPWDDNPYAMGDRFIVFDRAMIPALIRKLRTLR